MVTAVAIPRALNEPVGLSDSSLMYSLSSPSDWPRKLASCRGVIPSPRVTGRSEPMVDALKKLSKDNLSNLTPHPFYVFLNYTHPPVVKRIEALESE